MQVKIANTIKNATEYANVNAALVHLTNDKKSVIVIF
jgi:hypothetical protein